MPGLRIGSQVPGLRIGSQVPGLRIGSQVPRWLRVLGVDMASRLWCTSLVCVFVQTRGRYIAVDVIDGESVPVSIVKAEITEKSVPAMTKLFYILVRGIEGRVRWCFTFRPGHLCGLPFWWPSGAGYRLASMVPWGTVWLRWCRGVPFGFDGAVGYRLALVDDRFRTEFWHVPASVLDIPSAMIMRVSACHRRCRCVSLHAVGNADVCLCMPSAMQQLVSIPCHI